MSKKTILVVDDYEHIRSALNTVLSPDHEVIEAADGEEAIEILSSQKIDLVILDLNMPNTDGWEALRIIRDEDNWPDLPVVILTVRKQPENALKGWYLGATKYVTKPFSLSRLTAVVEEILSEKVQ